MSSLNHTFSFRCLEVRRSISHKSSNHFTQETQALRYQSLVLIQTSGTPKGSSDLFSVTKEAFPASIPHQKSILPHRTVPLPKVHAHN